MLNRRQSLATIGSIAACATLGNRSSIAESETRGNAEHVISIWLGGGIGQIDSFDPKMQGDPKQKKPGSYYSAIDTSVPGIQLCEHFQQLAPFMEHVTIVRSVHHEVIDEHAAATNRMHTGRTVSGSVVYPSLGSIIANQRGAASEDAPPYVLIGYPNITRGPGFLGAGSGYLYLTDTSQGPIGLSRPPIVTAERQLRREQFLSQIDSASSATRDDPKLRNYDSAIKQSMKLSDPAFNQAFQLSQEPDDLRNKYGGEFGQRCLLSRRLVERGVRFIEVSHNLNFLNGSGWDVHNEGIQHQHELLQELDSAVASLMIDLKEKRLLDKTLIVITTEFGRPAEFDSGGGRGHQCNAFSCVLAGGGLNHCGAYGTTDELAKTIVSDPVSVPDLFATIFSAVQIDPSKSLFDGDRPVPITDNGIPILH